MKKWIKLLRDAGAYKAGEIVEVEASIAKAYIDAGAAEESAGAAPALETALAAEIGRSMTAVTSELQKGLKAIADDLKETTKNLVRIDPGESEADKRKSFADQIDCITRFQKRGDSEGFERLTKVYGCQPVNRKGEVIRGHEGAAGQTAGFLIGVEYGQEVLKLDPESDVFASGVRVIPMGSPQKKYPAVRQTSGAPVAGSSAMHGGIRTFRKSEKAARTPTQADFDEIELNATDLIAYTEATNDLLDDAPGAEQDFLGMVRGALGWRRDWDFMNGSGTNEPLGFRNAPCLIKVNRKNAGKIAYSDVVALLSRILPAYMGQVGWLANPLSLPNLSILTDDAGTPIYRDTNFTPAGPLPPTLLGRPVRYTEKAPAPGEAGDLACVVPGLYLEGQRAGVEIGVSEEFLFSTDQVAYRAKIRNDGKPWMKGVYTMPGGGTLSGFAQLNA